MSHLLKRTKKSCLKIFRKISSSKQLFAKKLDDIDDTRNNNKYSNNNNNSSNNNNQAKCAIESNYGDYGQTMKTETSPIPKKDVEKDNEVDMEMEIEMGVGKGKGTKNKVNDSFRRSTESLPSMKTYHHQTENDKRSPKEISKWKGTISADEGSPNNTILHKLTARLFLTADGYDFHRLQHLRSDTGSEIVQFDNDNDNADVDVDVDMTEFTTTTEDDIVFEKVKYKDDIRYFRHTPSNSSLDNYRISGSIGATPELDFASDWQLTDVDGNNQKRNNQQQFTNFGFQISDTKVSFMPKINVSLGSKFNGNRQNVVISQERDNNNKLMPIVKWDINGNSLDDDDEILPHEYLEDFDKRMSKRLAAIQNLQMTFNNNYNNDNDHNHDHDNNHNDNSSSDSSLRSSSTTLETWVDEDLIVENSLPNSLEMTLRENRCLIKA